MDIKQGRRKSFDVEYVEVTEENIDEIAAWCGGFVQGTDKDRFVKIMDKNAMNARQTKAFIGDYVVHSLENRSFKCFGRKPFAKTFDRIEHNEVNRSAVTGQFVTDEVAHANPDTTVTEQISLPADADLS